MKTTLTTLLGAALVLLVTFGSTPVATAQAVETETQKLIASGGPFNDFGWSVSISGDYAIVGGWISLDALRPAEEQAGAACVFERIGGIWTQVAWLTASDGAAYDTFGGSVAISGDYAIVGAPGDDDNGRSSGSAYVFERIGGIWTETAKLTASDGATYHGFGSVSISGDYAIVGAVGDDDNGHSSGSAYVFERLGGVWTETAKLTASDGVPYHDFGGSVSISGGHGIVGASGSAYVFERLGGIWTETAKLTASDGAPYDYFGHSVSISGDHAIVGAHGDGDEDFLDTGAAYVFERCGGAWIEAAKLTASVAPAPKSFGWSVSISGDHAIVGARHDSPSSAYMYERIGGSWTPGARLIASDGGDSFGTSVSISGNHAFVGDDFDFDNPGQLRGSAYVFEFEPVNAPPAPTIVAPSSGALAEVGSALSFEGSIADDDPAGTHTAEWIISSPTMPATSIPGTVSGYSVSDPIEFTEAGVYAIKLVVTDPDGATGEAMTVNDLPAYVVVYDPEGGFVTGGGWVNSPPGSFYPALADSVDDWDSTGEQGANGWSYGYREVHCDGAIDYDPAADFIPFSDDWWNGLIWNKPNADGDNLPRIFIGPVAGRPKQSPHQWPIRRWVSDVSGDVDITHHIAMAHRCGNGATGAVHHNGIRIGCLVAEAVDGGGASQVLTAAVEVGDTIDFILSPVGIDGAIDDSCDTSYFGGRVTVAGTADYAQLGGWANFGFVSKYKKGAHVPTGQTEFQYHARHFGENVPDLEFNFQSSSYDWLVVAGARAKFKGVGTINGKGEYGFMVTATDGKVPGGGDVDRFRIKIWDIATGIIVYDNQAGSNDDADLNDNTVVQGGNIVVHK